MGKKRNKKDKNPWNTPSSGSETDRINSADETYQQQMQEELQRKVTQTMAQVGMLDRFVEVMAAAGENEREEMLKKYEAEMPKELGEGYVAASRAAIEKEVREKGDEMERMRKVELIREGVRRRYFRESSGPEDILDFGGIHSGRKFEDVYLDHKSYAQWVLELGQPHMWTLRCFQYFLLRLMDLERILKGGRGREQKMREERLEVSESLVEEMALEERNMVEDFKRVRWADLEDEERGSWSEQNSERQEEKGSEAVVQQVVKDEDDDEDKKQQAVDKDDDEDKEQQAAKDDDDTRDGKRRTTTRTRNGKRRTTTRTRKDKRRTTTRGKARQTADGGSNKARQEADGNNSKARRAAGDDDVRARQATDNGDGAQRGGRQEQNDDDDDDGGGGTRQDNEEERQQQGKGEGKQSLEELIRTVKLRMQQEKEQEQMNGEDEARRESEAHRRKKKMEQEITWETGKGKGMERERGTMRKDEGGIGEMTRQEGKGRGGTGIQKVWEDWWQDREAKWMNEEWGELSGDDLDMGEKGLRLRREQWEEVRSGKMRNQSIYKAEKVGEEMGNEIKKACRRMSWRNERWRSPAEENDWTGFESLRRRVERLGRRVEELEGERRKAKYNRQMTESSSGSEEGGGKWRWDGENWWFKVNHRGPINSRLRRKISRTIAATIDETKRRGDELFELRARVESLETERSMQHKAQVGEAP